MKSHRTFQTASANGFTLVEILVGIGIFLLILGIIMVFSFSDYQRYIFRKDRDVAIAVLAKARSRAMNNFAESRHGVHVEQDEFTLFRGSDYLTSDPATWEVIPASAVVTKSGSSDIVFEQLTGNVLTNSTIRLQNRLSDVTISINNEGRIDW